MSPPLISLLIITTFAVSRTSAQSGSPCLTPNGESARCISIYSCKVLFGAVSTTDPQVIRFLKESQCGFADNPLVCCGSRARFASGKPVEVDGGSSSGGGGGGLLPSEDECGIQEDSSKVLNGETAGLQEFPWMALLRYRNSSGGESNSCGGTLISDRYVITAAHCLTGAITTAIGRLVSVRLGEWNTKTHPDCVQSQGFNFCSEDPINVRVAESIPHPQYDDSSRDRLHDIGLVRLESRVKFTSFIRPVCLPNPTEKARVGDLLSVVGWGRTETGNYSDTKQKLLVPVADAAACAATFRTQRVTLRGSQLCAGGEKDKDSCKGDSGGPLLNKREQRGQFFIEGVVSFGARCGTAGWPGIYTRVSSYLGWIEQNVRA